MPSRPRLIPYWRRAWRLVSVQVGAAAIGFGLLPPDQQASLLAWAGLEPTRVPAVLGLLFILGRVVHQPDKAAP